MQAICPDMDRNKKKIPCSVKSQASKAKAKPQAVPYPKYSYAHLTALLKTDFVYLLSVEEKCNPVYDYQPSDKNMSGFLYLCCRFYNYKLLKF